MAERLEIGQTFIRRAGPPMRVTVRRPSPNHDGWFDCHMDLNGRSFGTRPVPGDLLLSDQFALGAVGGED